MTGWPDNARTVPSGARANVFDGLHETAHHVAVGAGEQGHGEAAAGPHQTGRDRLVLERHADQLGLHADLDHEVGRHHVDLVAVTAADQVEAGRERPQDTAAVAVEVVGGGVGRRGHPKMLPEELSVVVVVEGVRPVDLADALEDLLIDRLGLDGVVRRLGQEALVGGAGGVALVRRRPFVVVGLRQQRGDVGVGRRKVGVGHLGVVEHGGAGRVQGARPVRHVLGDPPLSAMRVPMSSPRLVPLTHTDMRWEAEPCWSAPAQEVSVRAQVVMSTSIGAMKRRLIRP